MLFAIHSRFLRRRCRFRCRLLGLFRFGIRLHQHRRLLLRLLRCRTRYRIPSAHRRRALRHNQRPAARAGAAGAYNQARQRSKTLLPVKNSWERHATTGGCGAVTAEAHRPIKPASSGRTPVVPSPSGASAGTAGKPKSLLMLRRLGLLSHGLVRRRVCADDEVGRHPIGRSQLHGGHGAGPCSQPPRLVLPHAGCACVPLMWPHCAA